MKRQKGNCKKGIKIETKIKSFFKIIKNGILLQEDKL